MQSSLNSDGDMHPARASQLEGHSGLGGGSNSVVVESGLVTGVDKGTQNGGSGGSGQLGLLGPSVHALPDLKFKPSFCKVGGFALGPSRSSPTRVFCALGI